MSNNNSTETMMHDVVQHITEAYHQALKRGILANAVLINDAMLYSTMSLGCREVPIIAGLKVVYCKDDIFPDNVKFMILELDKVPLTKDEEIVLLKQENSQLKEKLKQIKRLFREDN